MKLRFPTHHELVAIGSMLIATLIQPAWCAPTINFLDVPTELIPGEEFSIAVETSKDVSIGSVLVDLRPWKKSLLRFPLKNDNNQWIAQGAFPASLEPPEGAVARITVLVQNKLRESARTNTTIPVVKEVITNPEDMFLVDVGALTLMGVSTTGFNSTSSTLEFILTGSEFLTDFSAARLIVNGQQVDDSHLLLGSQKISATGVLVSGKNTISFKSYNTVGQPLHLTEIVWAGNTDFPVNILDGNGQPFSELATVNVTSGDDASIGYQTQTNTGSVLIPNAPNSTLLVEVLASGNRRGIAGTANLGQPVNVTILAFNPPSPVDNNDFALGFDGWEIGSAPVQIVEHIEGPAPIRGVATSSPAFDVPLVQAMSLATVINNDLVLSTGGTEGLRSVARSFPTAVGVTSVRVRYRFITSEVPGGFFGSEYNDYFRVSLRSVGAGDSISESNTMNGLGLGAFDLATGSTMWRDLVLNVQPQGDVIQLDVGVANVEDEILDSEVVIDFVEELGDQVTPSLAWNNVQGGIDLTYTVDGNPLSQDVSIAVHWASGKGYPNRLGAAIVEYQVPAGTGPGSYGPIRIPGGNLRDDPTGVSYIIASFSPTKVGALPDVGVNYGAHADRTVVSAAMLDIFKDGLRAAGQSQGWITSTARTAEDQARAMFENLTNPKHTIAENIAAQNEVYAAAGEKVISVFEHAVEGLTRPQILVMSAAIQDEMEAEIKFQGAINVTRHAADPAKISVVDVSAGQFIGNGALFVNSVVGRLSNFINEESINNCYHMERSISSL
jgi:hypothetical protein